MSPMSRADVLRMFEAFDTLAEFPGRSRCG